MKRIDAIIAYEVGELSDRETLKLFAGLIKEGVIWSLQGHYGRTASALIQDNWISQSGEINSKKVKENGI